MAAAAKAPPPLRVCPSTAHSTGRRDRDARRGTPTTHRSQRYSPLAGPSMAARKAELQQVVAAHGLAGDGTGLAQEAADQSSLSAPEYASST